MNITDLVAFVQERHHLPDPAALELLCATYVAARLPTQTAFWLVFVAPASSGKTALFFILDGLAQVQFVTTFTEASMLSATSTKEGPVLRGILPDVGLQGGLLVFPDLTAMFALGRAETHKSFRLLRAVHDHKVERHLASYSRPLSWPGGAGFLGATTERVESEHEVLAEMGERFTYYRFPAHGHEERLDLARVASASDHREAEVNDSLRTAVQSFLRGLTIPTELQPLSVTAAASLARICDFATTCRTAVPRVRRVTQFVPELEEIPRLQRQVYVLIQALLVMGVGEEEIWRLVHEVTYGSIPKVRREVIEAVMQRPQVRWELRALANELSMSWRTIRPAVEDLVSFGVLEARDATPDGLGPSPWLRDNWAATHVEEYLGIATRRKRRARSARGLSR